MGRDRFVVTGWRISLFLLFFLLNSRDSKENRNLTETYQKMDRPTKDSLRKIRTEYIENVREFIDYTTENYYQLLSYFYEERDNDIASIMIYDTILDNISMQDKIATDIICRDLETENEINLPFLVEFTDRDSSKTNLNRILSAVNDSLSRAIYESEKKALRIAQSILLTALTPETETVRETVPCQVYR